MSDNQQVPFVNTKDGYFDSYSHAGIHEDMIKDSVRTTTYKNAILFNKHLFKDKVVLDVGCGTGILSMFAAKAGAKHVIGVDFSSIALQAKKIVSINKLDHIVTIVHGKVEDLVLPHGLQKVDIIISEWMGYSLLYESMLDTVLFARDNWLVEGGLIFPDKASMYVCGIEDAYYKSEKVDWWDSVYGFDMSPMKKLSTCEPFVDNVDPKVVMTDVALIKEIDICTVTTADLDHFKSKFTLNCSRPDFLHALVLFFDVTFSKCHTPISFTTSPFYEPTHWKQTIFYLKDQIVCEENEQVECEFELSKNKEYTRAIDFKLTVDFVGTKSTLNEVNQYYMR